MARLDAVTGDVAALSYSAAGHLREIARCRSIFALMAKDVRVACAFSRFA